MKTDPVAQWSFSELFKSAPAIEPSKNDNVVSIKTWDERASDVTTAISQLDRTIEKEAAAKITHDRATRDRQAAELKVQRLQRRWFIDSANTFQIALSTTEDAGSEKPPQS